MGEAIAQAVGAVVVGAHANDAAVLGGGAYLVGERGPEVFRPTGAGTIEAAGGAGVTINMRVDGGAQGLLRSEAQIAQMLARAVALGARRLSRENGSGEGVGGVVDGVLGIGAVFVAARLAVGDAEP